MIKLYYKCFMNENDNVEQDLTQEFLNEIQAREFIEWRSQLTDEKTISWINLLMEECDNLDAQLEEAEKELESKEFLANYFTFSVLFLFVYFAISILKNLILH